jgi:hypothetical protein
MSSAFRVILWLLAPVPALAVQQGRRPADSPLDAWFEAEWKRQGLKPAPPANDAVFLRRVSLDLTGSLPPPEDVRAFLKSSRKEKRVEKIDELIASPKAAEYFAHLWVQWLMGHDIGFRDQAQLGLGELARWLREAWARDLPYDALVRQFLGATGRVRENPPVNFIAKHLARDEPPSALAGASARLFLGKDIRCAQCHDHPFEKITQEGFWGYAAFFRTLVRTDGGVAEGPARKPASPREDLGELFSEPRFLDGRSPEPGEARGAALARLVLTAEGNAAARAVVDRVWKLFFGRSLAPGRGVQGKPELLDLLVQDFVDRKWSLRGLVRSIALSRTYQLSSEGPEAARREYAAGPLKMMNSIQFMRVWNFAFQWETFYRRLYAKDAQRVAFFSDPDAFWVDQTMRAKELLFPKGRDPEEVLASGTDRLALKLMNNRDLQLLMLAKFQETGHKSLVHRVVDDLSDPGRRLEELFLLMVSRPPTDAEKSRLLAHAKRFVDPYQAFGDVFWMLFNSSEFIFVG